ncbi:MAG: DUF1573 domain-containing protein [Prevotellaceae bacterium]|jgi:hypothetical protein|nr:DUF1573 domain-containing protein [Prevotellaceae bacterium]
MITPFLLYILKVNIVVAVFHLFYWLFLRRETFYVCNRAYFISALVLAILFPLIDFSIFFPTARPLIFILTGNPVIDVELTGANRGLVPSDYVTIILLSGVSLLILRLIMQLVSLFRLYIVSGKTVFCNKKMVTVDDRVNPFSFFNWVFINPQLHEADDLHEIIAHENIHVKQYHTADILLYELAAATCWYNPFIWLMRKAMKQNLEYLTDRQVLREGYNKQHYQYNFLKVSRIPVISGIVNNFNFNDLKNRIAMMNKKQSPNGNLLKFVLVIPVFVGAALIMNAQNITSRDTTQSNKSPYVGVDSITLENIKQQNNLLISKPIIAFDKLVHDFGTIIEADGETSAIFTFTNLGNKPLVLKKVSASCGCTTPEWIKEPIPPGGMGFIRATYNPLGRVAPFEKTLTVESNGEPNNVILQIKGLVVRR